MSEQNTENNITANEKGRRKPKIKVTNVSKDENDIVNKRKNPWMCNLITDDDDLKIIKEQQARNDKFLHYIIRCTPQISKAIFENDEKSYITLSRCNVYDCYMPYQCYKCQEF